MGSVDKDFNIPLKLFINEVHKRPVLWNVNLPEYKEKKKRRLAWEEICCLFYEDFEKKSNVEKSGISFTLSSKWRNVRDNYNRVHRVANAKNVDKKPYVHENLLHFLDAILEDKYKSNPKDAGSNPANVVDSVLLETEEIDIKPDLVDNNDQDIFYNEEPESSNIHAQQNNMNEEEDDDMAFYMSTLPMIRNLSQDQKIEFRIQVMNLIQKFYNKNNCT